MSCQEFHVGKLILLPKKDNETLEEQCKRICYDKCLTSNSEEEIIQKYDSFKDYISIEWQGIYFIYKDDLYEVDEDVNTYGDDDVYQAERLSNGNIYYITSFYNGGCYFNEALEDCLDKLKDKDFNNKEGFTITCNHCGVQM